VLIVVVVMVDDERGASRENNEQLSRRIEVGSRGIYRSASVSSLASVHQVDFDEERRSGEMSGHAASRTQLAVVSRCSHALGTCMSASLRVKANQPRCGRMQLDTVQGQAPTPRCTAPTQL
jgi:hypothetical protein